MLTIDGGKSQDDFHDEKVRDACWKIWIKPLKETNVGMAQALFDP